MDDEKPRTIQGGLVPLGPSDTFNGVHVRDLCADCRSAIARYEHRTVPHIVLCVACAVKVQTGSFSNQIELKPPSDDGLRATMDHIRVGRQPTPHLIPPQLRDQVERQLARDAHPAPWQWGDRGDDNLRDANGKCLIDSNSGAWPIDDRVRALTEAAPQLHTGVVALLDIIHQMVADAWPQRVVPDDVGPICANLRALTDAIDGRERPKGGD